MRRPMKFGEEEQPFLLWTNGALKEQIRRKPGRLQCSQLFDEKKISARKGVDPLALGFKKRRCHNSQLKSGASFPGV